MRASETDRLIPLNFEVKKYIAWQLNEQKRERSDKFFSHQNVLFGYNATGATLMGVPANHGCDCFVITQRQYATLVEAGKNSLITMVKALNDGILGHPVLA